MAVAASPSDRAVWSVWRGDRAKLTRVARAMESCYPRAELVRAGVVVGVLGDTERHRSIAAFAREASGQTTSSFDTLELITEGGDGRISVRLDRRPLPGVRLEIAPGHGGEEWAKRVRDAVEPAVSRGGIQWSWARGLPLLSELGSYASTRVVGDASAADALLAALRRSRARAMWAWTALLVALGLAVGYAVGRPGWEAGWGELAWVAPMIVALASLIALLPAARNAVLPAVEVAETTPGRRTLGRLSLLAAPVVAAVIRQIAS